MWLDKIKELFGPKKQAIVSKTDPGQALLIEEYYKYYLDFREKIGLFRKVKDAIISIKPRIYDTLKTRNIPIDEPTTVLLHKEVDVLMNEIISALNKIKAIIITDKDVEGRVILHSSSLIQFIERELEKYPANKQEEAYRTALLKLQEALVKPKESTYGLFHILTSQLNLLQEIETARNAIKNQDSEALIQKFRILEIEIMRLGKYIGEEAKIIQPSHEIIKPFETAYATLQNLGLVYSERELNPYNIKIIAMNLGKEKYGVKGIAILSDDNVEIRFVKGASEKHAEIVRMLMQGIPGTRLADSTAIKHYLLSMPLETMQRIAGYELQLEYENNELKLVRINFGSTILKFQIERQTPTATGEFFRMSKKDFERMSYALLYSIDKQLVDEKRFHQTIENTGTKIVITDQRIYPMKHD
ncbi:hypothetical protein HY486_02285 [Candidatus Woesearchaeota archaeon]|nr:hypothetical protein [Candidatus Woesearchaeota archaeon]